MAAWPRSAIRVDVEFAGHNESVTDNLRAMATETMAIIEAGGYRSLGGREVRIAAGARAAVAGTRLHLPDEKVPAPAPHGSEAPASIPG